MIEPDRVLRPLREAESAIARLDTYESPAVLKEALRATWHAIELSLRTLLRSDDTAPDGIRLTAMSATEMPVETVLREIRRRDLVSLPLAGRIHEFQQVLDRAEAGDPKAADADTALDVVRLLETEVERVARSRSRAASTVAADRTSGRAEPDAASWAAPRSAEPHSPIGGGAEQAGSALQALRRGPRRPLWVVAGAVAVLVVVATLLLLRGGAADMERGVEAFGEGRAGVAEQHFRAALSRDEDNVTARLYLARILREQSRLQEAADLLRGAARVAPADAAVRRELGYLFLDLNRPPAAVEQFHTAVELEPDEALNWVGLVVALRRAEDRSADEWLRRAPAEARALLGSARQ